MKAALLIIELEKLIQRLNRSDALLVRLAIDEIRAANKTREQVA